MSVRHHLHVHRADFRIRELIGKGLVVLLATLPHFFAYDTSNPMAQAITARLPYLAVLYAAISGGLLIGLTSGLVAGGLIYAVMAAAHHPVAGSVELEHLVEIPFYVALGAAAGYLRDHLRYESSEKEHILDMFSRYVSPAVVPEILKRGVNLVGTELHATVLFADIRSFTTLSEQLTPAEVLRILNVFFSEMAAIIFRHGGMLDKYIGDAIMAEFGVPLPGKQDAHCAIQAGLGMLTRLREMNKQRAFGDRELSIGIGIHSGRVMAGNVGCKERIEYTVIGDTVNIASRLQELTKQYNCPLIASAETIEESGVQGAQFLGEIPVRGKVNSVRILSLGAANG